MSRELYRDRDSGEIYEVTRDSQGRFDRKRYLENPTRSECEEAKPGPNSQGHYVGQG